MAIPTYHLTVDSDLTAESREDVMRAFDHLRAFDHAEIEDSVTLESTIDRTVYADLALKALAVLALFLIAAHIGG